MTRTITIEISSEGVRKVSGNIDSAKLLVKLKPLIHEFDERIQQISRPKVNAEKAAEKL